MATRMTFPEGPSRYSLANTPALVGCSSPNNFRCSITWVAQRNSLEHIEFRRFSRLPNWIPPGEVLVCGLSCAPEAQELAELANEAPFPHHLAFS